MSTVPFGPGDTPRAGSAPRAGIAPRFFIGLLVVATAACRTPTAQPIAGTAQPSTTSAPPAAPPSASAAPALAAPPAAEPALRVVATTSIIADVVRAVGGDRVAVTTLVGPGADPHGYKPSPGDLAAIESAAIIFENGLQLEVSLEPLLLNVAGQVPRIAVSDGIATMRGAADGERIDNPHVWWDPVRVKVWTVNIARALGASDPPGAATYQANASTYAAELDTLDAWIRAQTSALPPERRVLVTDHEVLGYFAAAYGFTEVGAVVPGVSTEAEPSAKDVAALEAAIAAHGVPAIFTGETVTTALSERVAADTGTRLVSIHAEALSAPDGPAATYLAFMRHNVTTIVEALR